MTLIVLRLFFVVGLIVATVPGAASGGALASGWATKDIGRVGAEGSAATRDGVFTVAGSGTDIWNTADEFRFVYQQLTGDGSIVTRVTALEKVDDWAKAGVMMRDTLGAGSRYALMLVSPGNGLAFQRRTATGGEASSVSGGSGKAPQYLKLTRDGSTFSAYKSTDGAKWTKVGSQSISMGSTIYVGLAVVSGDGGELATAKFEKTAVTTSADLPAGWATKDIGSVGVKGDADRAGDTFTVKGAGDDIWGTRDEFRFAYTTLSGDGSVVTRVATLEKVDAWVKAGVMMRETLDANSRHAFMLVSPSKGLAFQRRTSTGGTTTHTSGGSGAAPYYLKLTRAGKTFTAYKSTSGKSWTKVGSQSISMASKVYVGLAVSSHDAGDRATATFTATDVTDGDPGDTGEKPDPAPAPRPAPKPAPDPDPAPEVDPAQTKTLRVMHWNLYHGQNAKKKYSLSRQMEVIYKAKPDIVSLNEVEKFSSSYGNVDQAAEIAKYLTQKTGQKWYQYMRVGSGSSKGIGNAVLSRFPMDSTSYCQLSDTRNAVHASVVVNGRTVNFFSTHLAVESGSYRVKEAKTLLDCMDNFSQQRLVAGDFNAQAGASELRLMTDGHSDAWAKAKSLNATTNYSGNCDGCTRNSRIDYLFTSKSASALQLKSVQMIDTRDGSGVMASDHKPMVTVFSVR
jgi:endonuclease/exonuclease/phosphatase family metal-dependent hydrolase